ncbi:c-type cytochrome biogenesis protein CcmI [Sulfitobacter sp.]|uniref:c-type cytochrome biogenesis protein CcmI n=1 Tax=Sulfitobacter sp. TaxID=1903071 RepID=UPI003F6CA26F
MIFWLIAAAGAALVSLVLLRALWRGAHAPVPARTEHDLQVYRDQLAEVEREVAREVLSEADAARVRTEISRRILAADTSRADAVQPGAGPSKLVMGVIALAMIGGSLALYLQLGAPGYGDLALKDRIAFAQELRENRPTQAAAQAGLPPTPGLADLSPEYAALLKQLRETVAKRPDDIQGQTLLAQNEARVGNFVAAATAQSAVVRIKGAEASVEDVAGYAELLVLAAGGYVSPEAEAVLRAVLARDVENGTARYYWGLMLVQTGRPDQAFKMWDGLLRRGPEDAPWIEPILAQIEPIAEMAGVDYTVPEIGVGALRGPSADDIEAAQDMTPAQRMEMIGSMVDGLSERLATQGGPVEDWSRLISSLGVLGQTDRAQAIYDNALEVFAGDPSALDEIFRAGERASLAQ